MLPAIRTLTEADLPALLELNNAHAVELSWLDRQKLAAMLGQAFAALVVGAIDAALLAFAEDSAYPGRNFAWFRARYTRFVYVDRIVVAPAARGRGLARLLYQALFDRARAGGAPLVACEVNREPPNPASTALHEALGFTPVGEALFAGKRVIYFTRRLD